MLHPTQDKTTRQAILYQATKFLNLANATLLIDDILDLLERNGYHKGLPDSIVEALNSGDGVYRP